MDVWRIEYTYACWKCPTRHESSYTVNARNMVVAFDAWLSDLRGDFDGTWDYEPAVIKIGKETQ